MPLPQPLLTAIVEEKISALKNIINESSFDVNTQDENGNTLLHIAMKNDKFYVARWLLENPETDMFVRNNNNEMAHEAVNPVYINVNDGYNTERAILHCYAKKLYPEIDKIIFKKINPPTRDDWDALIIICYDEIFTEIIDSREDEKQAEMLTKNIDKEIQHCIERGKPVYLDFSILLDNVEEKNNILEKIRAYLGGDSITERMINSHVLGSAVDSESGTIFCKDEATFLSKCQELGVTNVAFGGVNGDACVFRAALGLTEEVIAQSVNLMCYPNTHPFLKNMLIWREQAITNTTFAKGYILSPIAEEFCLLSYTSYLSFPTVSTFESFPEFYPFVCRTDPPMLTNFCDLELVRKFFTEKIDQLPENLYIFLDQENLIDISFSEEILPINFSVVENQRRFDQLSFRRYGYAMDSESGLTPISIAIWDIPTTIDKNSDLDSIVERLERACSMQAPIRSDLKLIISQLRQAESKGLTVIANFLKKKIAEYKAKQQSSSSSSSSDDIAETKAFEQFAQQPDCSDALDEDDTWLSQTEGIDDGTQAEEEQVRKLKMDVSN